VPTSYPQLAFPVYRLAEPRIDPASFDAFAVALDTRAAGAGGIQHNPDRLRVGQAGSWYVDKYLASGGIWYVDQARSWSSSLPLVGALGVSSSLMSRASTLFDALHLPGAVTQIHDNLGVSTVLKSRQEYRPHLTYVRKRDPVSGTVHQGHTEAGVSWRPSLAIRLPTGRRLRAPIVGPAIHQAAFRGEELVRLNGTWREIERVDHLVEGVHPRHARAAALRLLRDDGLRDVTASVRLVYPSAPAAYTQTLLEPRYEVRARFRRGPRRYKLMLRSLLLPVDLRHVRLPSPCAASYVTNLRIGLNRLPIAPAVVPGFTIGCWWPQDDLMSQFSCPSAFNLVATIGSQGSVPVLLGGAYAMHYQWDLHADEWVERMRIAYVQSHGSSEGWVVGLNPATMSDRGASMVTPETARQASHWGTGELRWIVVGACGPLQDARAGGAGNAEINWADAFNGLQGLLGFADVSTAKAEEGPQFARYLLQGESVKEAWFKAAADTQSGARGRVHVAAVLKGTQSDPLSPGTIPRPADTDATDYFKQDCQ
jgi:hypothetical protein